MGRAKCKDLEQQNSGVNRDRGRSVEGEDARALCGEIKKLPGTNCV